ncbi:MAG: ankyrin repeat domain-containing protein [Candidatus Eremiobacteraeota bacterium]|nr:ankyrin repeat domain-containing protein [Candidatus Eremiobacteraeota bacterium]
MASPDIPVGTVLNQKYKVLRFLGEGGMNRVYLVADPGGRTFAMKVTRAPSETGSSQGETTEQFYREVEILTRFPHECLPALEDYFTLGGGLYLVEEHIDGVSLEEYAATSLFGEDEAIALALTLCDVLTFLHRRGIIYRDLKPANIVVTADRRLKLIDFDIARFYRHGKTADTVALGTPGYAAPETYGKAQSSAPSDIYSLGATLHHLVTGINPQDRPFHFSPPAGVRADLTPAFSAVIEKALSMNPRDRFPSAASMKKALMRLRPGGGRGAPLFEELLSRVASGASRLGKWGSKACVKFFSPSWMGIELLKAVQDGDLAKAKRLIDEGYPVNEEGNSATRPLQEAVKRGDRPMVELLLNKGTRLDLRGAGGMTPRDQAFFSGNLELERLLKKRGGPLHVYDPSGMMKTHKAAAEGDRGALLRLVGVFREDLLRQDEQGRLPLHYAVMNGHRDLVSLLMGAELCWEKLGVRDRNGQTPLHMIRDLPMARALHLASGSSSPGLNLRPDALNIADREGRTPLSNAVERGDVKLAEFFLDLGARVNDLTREKESLLHLAVRQGSLEMAELLMKKGVKLNHRDKKALTALMMAIETGRWKIAELLLERRAGVNIEDGTGKTPLMASAECGNALFAEKLIHKGADVGRCDHSGMTALHYAAAAGSTLLVKRLLVLGADAGAADHFGRTPLMVAHGSVAPLFGGE